MDWQSLSDQELIRFCPDAAPERVLGKGYRGVKLSDKVAIKFGEWFFEDEAENRERARELVDPEIVHVPRVYRFFRDEEGWGYMLMEHVEGQVIDPFEDPDKLARVVRVMDHFSQIKGEKPASLSGCGICRGLIWHEDEEEVRFDDIAQMEAWFNSRLFPGQSKVSFKGCDLVLCHLDVAPRNIIWEPDGRICLVDWRTAGFFPRVCEFWSHWTILAKEGKLSTILQESMRPLPEHENAQYWPMCQVYSRTPCRTQKLALLLPSLLPGHGQLSRWYTRQTLRQNQREIVARIVRCLESAKYNFKATRECFRQAQIAFETL